MPRRGNDKEKSLEMGLDYEESPPAHAHGEGGPEKMVIKEPPAPRPGGKKGK